MVTHCYNSSTPTESKKDHQRSNLVNVRDDGKKMASVYEKSLLLYFNAVGTLSQCSPKSTSCRATILATNLSSKSTRTMACSESSLPLTSWLQSSSVRRKNWTWTTSQASPSLAVCSLGATRLTGSKCSTSTSRSQLTQKLSGRLKIATWRRTSHARSTFFWLVL